MCITRKLIWQKINNKCSQCGLERAKQLGAPHAFLNTEGYMPTDRTGKVKTIMSCLEKKLREKKDSVICRCIWGMPN